MALPLHVWEKSRRVNHMDRRNPFTAQSTGPVKKATGDAAATIVSLKEGKKKTIRSNYNNNPHGIRLRAYNNSP